MNISRKLALLLLLIASLAGTVCADEQGFAPIFDGRSLDGWKAGDPSYWTVEDGAITARITRDHPGMVNQYLVWQGGELADFELKLETRVNGEGGINNGFQFRSRLLPDNDICGYQVDNNLQTPWLVRLYDEYGRHDLALRGERAEFFPGGVRTASALPEAAGDAWFRLEEWHEYHLVCVGGRITLHVNGKLAAEIEDRDMRRAEPQGILALQLHSGPPTVAQFRNIRLKILKPAEPVPQPVEPSALFKEALAFWQLDSAGRGAAHPLTSVPQFYQLQLNVASTGTGATPGARCVVLDGAYFDAGKDLHVDADQLTTYLRARDPEGKWDWALFAKRGGHAECHFNFFSADLGADGVSDIGFELCTDQGFKMVSFPVSRIDKTAWHDLVGRYDGKEMAIFCDGLKMVSEPHSGKIVHNDEPMLIGAETDNGKPVRPFHGELETAALWARALTDQEVADLSR